MVQESPSKPSRFANNRPSPPSGHSCPSRPSCVGSEIRAIDVHEAWNEEYTRCLITRDGQGAIQNTRPHILTPPWAHCHRSAHYYQTRYPTHFVWTPNCIVHSFAILEHPDAFVYNLGVTCHHDVDKYFEYRLCCYCKGGFPCLLLTHLILDDTSSGRVLEISWR